MARRRTQPKSQPPQQPYDSALKGLMDTHAAEIIPEFVPDSQLIRQENSEIERESIRADLVYRIQHKGMPHILNMELQTNADSEMLNACCATTSNCTLTTICQSSLSCYIFLKPVSQRLLSEK